MLYFLTESTESDSTIIDINSSTYLTVATEVVQASSTLLQVLYQAVNILLQKKKAVTLVLIFALKFTQRAVKGHCASMILDFLPRWSFLV